MLCVSCGQGGSKAKSEANEESAPAVVEAAEAEEASVPMAYSKAYDGYTNIREAATDKSAVLAKHHNGPKGAEIIGVEGKWTKVRVNGIEGYIWTADTQTTPSDPVYISSASYW